MRSSRYFIALLVASATVPISACSRTTQAAGDLAPAASIGLSVTNQNFLDMDVYAVSDGLATRLGTVDIAARGPREDVRLGVRPGRGSGARSLTAAIV